MKAAAYLTNWAPAPFDLVAAGALQGEKGRFPIKVPGIIESAEDILTLPIKVDGDRLVHFSDIARVHPSIP